MQPDRDLRSRRAGKFMQFAAPIDDAKRAPAHQCLKEYPAEHDVASSRGLSRRLYPPFRR